ncbi:acyltransferase family protein [Bombilactobacillus bombi]|uniref:acyltransferase family protein n=1 Tax=Bombilactobacillus bombi TaxID=1303590 RepID=UPI0021753774|nr:acyltransferase family protein [Bombilactobacillus bombi]
MINTVKPRRYITGFDGLRTIGVLGVILYHLNPDVFLGGYLGVPIFLVLSGYLITDQILRSLQKRRTFDFQSYYSKRFKRLYPGLLLMLFSSSAYMAFFQKNLLANLRSIFITNVLNVFNFWQIAHGQSYFERFAGNQSPFTHMWTLSIQGQFYFIWPLILVFLLRLISEKRVVALTFIATVISAVLMALLYNPKVDPSRVYYGTDTRIFSIFLGCLLAFIWPTNHLRKNILKKDKILLDLLGAISLLVMLIFIFTMEATQPFMYRGGMLIFSIFTTILVAVVAHPASIWNRLLTNKLFKEIGKLSYGIYLYQFPVMIFFEAKVMNIADHRFLYPILEICLIIAISWLSYHFFEQPLAQYNWWSWFKKLFQSRRIVAKLELLSFSFIVLAGSYGLVQSQNVNAKDVNHSQLAIKIKNNHLKNKKNNQRILQKMHGESHKTTKAQRLQIKKWQQAAKEHPVNLDYQKMGLSQFDLQRAQDLSALAIGDSVMVDGSDGLRQIFPNMLINADVSRGIDVAIDLLKNYKAQNVLPQVVIIGMGTNGMVNEQKVHEIMQIAGPKRQVFWINVHVPTRSWEKPVNSVIAQQTQHYNNLQEIDWYTYAKNHSDWFFDDQVHTNDKGSKYYSYFIAKQILKKVKY